MRGLRIKDKAPRGYLACDLRDFFEILGASASGLRWLVVGDVWATGERSQELESLANSGKHVSTDKLKELAEAVTQVIDGEFAGYRLGDEAPWVIVRAIDSAYFELMCGDEAILENVRKRFADVSACEDPH